MTDFHPTWFVERKDGVIIALYACCQEGFAEEEVLADDPEVLSFFETHKAE